MLNHKLLLMILVGIFSVTSFSYDPKNGNITGTVGPYVYKTPFSDTASGSTSRYKGDLALIIGGDINDKSSLEISIFHMNKQYFREEGLKSIVEEEQLMHLTMGYRRWVHPYFSGALGFYSAYPMDNPKVVHNDFASGLEPLTSARDKTEYGLELSIQSELWSNDSITFVADARYAYSITNQPNEKGDHYGLMLGVKFVAQEKYPGKK